jgi:hypothetical protein
MSREIAVGLGLLLVLSSVRQAPAQTVYSDGLNHDVSAPSQAIELENDGTSLTILPGASVNGSAAFQGGSAVTGGYGTAINLLGGDVNSSSGPGSYYGVYGPAGIVANGAFAAFGGNVTGGDATGSSRAGDGVLIQGSTALFAGGTFQGGRGGPPGEYSGTGVGANFQGGNGQIVGGTFLGGVLADGAGLSISGGTFQGRSNALTIFSARDQTISGGSFQTGQPGVFTAAVEIFSSGTVSISGGMFGASSGTADSQVSLMFQGQGLATANISGGLFSGGFDLGLTDKASVNFIGSGLVFDPNTRLLTGTLEDGSLIDNLIDVDNPNTFHSEFTGYQYGVAPDGSEMVTFSAPEPSSIVAFSVGLAVVAISFVKARRRRTGLSRGLAGVQQSFRGVDL